MDLSLISRTQGELKVKHPVTGADLGTLSVISPESGAFRSAAMRLYQNARQANSGATPEEVLTSSPAQIMALIISGWDDKFAASIKEPYSQEAALKLCSNFDAVDWLMTEINKFVGDEANFFRSATDAAGEPSQVGRDVPDASAERTIAAADEPRVAANPKKPRAARRRNA